MISSLHIENIAVVKKVDIEFDRGFMVLTGQTGAGKSIIIDSINLLLGAKAERELIRKGESCATVTGVFYTDDADLLAFLSSLGLELVEGDSIIVQRSINADGRSQVRINGRAVNLSILKAIAPKLVSIHGQTDTHSLTESEAHLAIVDMYAENADILDKYKEKYRVLESVRSSIRDVSSKQAERERLREILEYQIKDIESLSLHDGEEEELVDKKIKIKNSEKIIKNSEFVFKALKGSEKGSVAHLLDRCATALSQLDGVIDNFGEYSEKLRDVLFSVEDIAEEVYAVLDDMDSGVDMDINAIEERLDKIGKLKRKYGLTIKDILSFRDNAQKELETLENADDILKKLEKEEIEAYNECFEIAKTLNDRRVSASHELEKKVKQTLEYLDMPKVVFFTSIKSEMDGERYSLKPDGYDLLEFYISANRGADPQPISRIASGGELARIMLALKSVIADKDGVGTVIFDEIDSGVSGKTARKIGLKMRSISDKTQLMCVTHSAQIASLASKHFLISKGDVNGATETSVVELDYDGRIGELSRILGGIDVTDAQRRAAIDMLKEDNIF